MPCNDITDHLELTIDANDTVVDYTLNKRTCGGMVGEDNMLGPWLFKRTVTQVMETTLTDFLAGLRTRNDLREYLALKHFLAVRTALEMYAGRQQDHGTIESVEYGPEGVRIVAHLDVAGLTEEIQVCMSCCGSRASRRDSAGFDV